MKIGQKLLMIGLSVLMMVTPCFAEHKIVAINGQQVVLDLYEKDNRNYVSPRQLVSILSEQGYKCVDTYENTDKVTITKNNRTLILSKATGEILEDFSKFPTIVAPLATITNYFGDSVEFPEISNFRKSFLKQFDSIEDTGKILNSYGTTTREMNEAAGKKGMLWESTLNILCSILLERLPENEQVKFKQEQEEWKIYRDNKVEEVKHKECDHSTGKCSYYSFLPVDLTSVNTGITQERCYELLVRLP